MNVIAEYLDQVFGHLDAPFDATSYPPPTAPNSPNTLNNTHYSTSPSLHPSEMSPHSQTVRGTLSNPKTQSAMNSHQTPPQLGDPVSLEAEKQDSIPLSSIRTPSSFRPADPYRENEYASSSSTTSTSPTSKNLPHSKQVRGTLGPGSIQGGPGGPELNNSMLGDPVSLKAETSSREWDLGAGVEEGVREAARRRGEYEDRAKSGRSKL